MIEPWQVWLADLDPTEDHEQPGTRPVLIVSSEVHLRGNQGRVATVVPITSNYRRWNSYVEIINPQGNPNWAIGDHIRTIDTRRFERTTAWWTLKNAEIDQIRRVLRYMTDY